MVGNEDRLFVYRSNYFVISGSRSDLTQVAGMFVVGDAVRSDFAARRACCIGHTAHENAWLLWTVMFIPTDLFEVQRRRCFVEQTTQPLGLFGDIPGSTLTLFDDRLELGRTDLTPFHIQSLRLLYSADVVPGLKRNQLRPIAKRYFNNQ